MNPRVKELWVTALRSDRYQQGRGHLKSLNKYCCLGVLCDLHRKEFGGEWDRDRYKGEYDVLPTDVRGWAEIERASPVIGRDTIGLPVSAVQANDLNGNTFLEIADMIEKNL